MGINSTEVSYSFGQLGSIFTNSTTAAINPPTGKVFVAITFLDDTTFDNDTGLVSDISNVDCGLEYAGTNTEAHDTGSSYGSAGGSKIDDNVNFQAGLTLYGRYTSISLKTGAIIAYIGE